MLNEIKPYNYDYRYGSLLLVLSVPLTNTTGLNRAHRFLFQ